MIISFYKTLQKEDNKIESDCTIECHGHNNLQLSN